KCKFRVAISVRLRTADFKEPEPPLTSHQWQRAGGADTESGQKSSKVWKTCLTIPIRNHEWLAVFVHPRGCQFYFVDWELRFRKLMLLAVSIKEPTARLAVVAAVTFEHADVEIVEGERAVALPLENF